MILFRQTLAWICSSSISEEMQNACFWAQVRLTTPTPKKNAERLDIFECFIIKLEKTKHAILYESKHWIRCTLRWKPIFEVVTIAVSYIENHICSCSISFTLLPDAQQIYYKIDHPFCETSEDKNSRCKIFTGNQESKVNDIKVLHVFIDQNLEFIDFWTLFSLKIFHRQFLSSLVSQNGASILYYLCCASGSKVKLI